MLFRLLLIICFMPCQWALGHFSATESYKPAPITVGFINIQSVKFDIALVDSYETVFVIKQTAQSLLDENEYGSIIPSVAKFWTISADTKTYTFHLRDDVRFHDGSLVSASEVKNSIELIKNSTVNPASYYLNRIEEIKVIDSMTLQISLHSPWFGFLHCLSSGLVPIFSSEAYKKDKSFVGSGPYILVKDNGNWLLKKYEKYRGPYQPHEDSFRILLSGDAKNEPDILINDLSHYPGFTGYQRSEIDSFVAFNFMVNPGRREWRDKTQRLMLIKGMLEAKNIVSSPRLKDLRDIFPKGMLGYDLRGAGFEKLMTELKDVDPGRLLKKKIVIGSLSPIMNFDKLAHVLAKKYGITATNFVTQSPNYLEKLRSNKSIDVFTVGWGSIFNHPDATFVPFYILGMKDLNDRIAQVIQQIGESGDLVNQFGLYRYLSFLAVSEGYVLPHSQVTAGMYTKSWVTVPNYRYRYTLQLSEVKAKQGAR